MEKINFTSYIKPMLLILVPVLNGLGELLKGVLVAENPSRMQKWIAKRLVDKSRLPLWLLVIGIILAAIYGLVFSTFTGWKYFLDAFVITGIVQGAACAFIAMGLFDSIKTRGAGK